MNIKIKPAKVTIKMNAQKIYPELENLEISPSTEEQIFKSDKYGYGNVKALAVRTEELNITPSLEEQNFEGLYSKVNVGGIQGEETSIIPSAETQTKEGLFTSVTVEGDSNLIPENIAQGKTIFNVEGTMSAPWDSSQIKRCDYMFENNTIMTEAPYFDMSGNTRCDYMFTGCSNMVKSANYNTKNVTNMMRMHASNSKLTECPEYDTSNSTSFAYMFVNCRALITVPLFKTDKLEALNYMFDYCYNLLNLGGFKELGKTFTRKTANYIGYKLDLSYCTLLTHDSLMNVINNLYDLNLSYNVAGGGTLYSQQLVLGSDNKAKLTAEEILSATNKGFTVL